MALFDTIRAGASGASDYEVERSLRFEDTSSPALSRTPSSASNQRTFTVSAWAKRLSFGSGHTIFSAGSNGSNLFAVYFPSEQFSVTELDGGSQHLEKNTTARFRDPTAWYHIVAAIDTTQSTAEDRVIAYINVVRITDYATNNIFSQNTDTIVNSTVAHYVGRMVSGNYFDGYIAEFNFIDGQQLTPSSFAETDAATGEYKPIKYTGTYGTNGFYLNFLDNSNTTASTMGKDSSGNGHNFTPSNLGTGDAVKDTPTNNFCTLNPIYDSGAAFGSSSLSECGLRYTGGSSNRSIGSTFGIRHTDTQGYYFEARIISGNTANRLFVGIGYTSTNWISTDARGANDDSWVLRNGDGVFIHNSSVDGETTGAGALSVGDIIQIAVKGSKIWVGKNGSYFFSGNPSGDSTPKFSDIASTWTPVADVMTSNVVQFNFGQDSSFSNSVTAQGNTDANGNGDFYHSPPTGFLALCSKNLPDSTIKLPNQHFNTVLYTGNNSTNVITGVGFQPDWFWIKDRSTTGEDHHLFDAVRGINKALYSNGTDQETTGFDSPTSNNNITAVSSDGFTITGNGSDGEGNLTGRNYVAWNWNAGGSTVTNNDGSVASEVRANTSAGFSIVTFSGSGNRTIGHGLGVAPQVIIMKGRNVTDQWTVGHQELDASNPWHKGIPLNTTASTQDNAGFWNDTAPTSTVFSKGTWDEGYNMVAYCFSEVAGYSKFGKYTGNGNSEGTYVFCGFRPAWVMIKDSSGSDSWLIMDNKRDIDNPVGNTLTPNSNGAENADTGGIPTDFLSNGFKCRGSGGDYNGSGETYIFLAFAERPFKNARAR